MLICSNVYKSGFIFAYEVHCTKLTGFSNKYYALVQTPNFFQTNSCDILPDANFYICKGFISMKASKVAL